MFVLHHNIKVIRMFLVLLLVGARIILDGLISSTSRYFATLNFNHDEALMIAPYPDHFESTPPPTSSGSAESENGLTNESPG